MSENVELVRRAYEAFNRRDADAIVAMMDPEGELYPYAIAEARGAGYHGHEGLRRYVADVEAMFETFEVDLQEFTEAADDTVFVRGRLRGRSRDGRDVDMAVGWLWTIHQGRLCRMQAGPGPA